MKLLKFVNQRLSLKKVFLKILLNSQENTCRSLFLIFFFIKKATRIQEFSCKFSEIFENTYYTEHLRVTASDYHHKLIVWF